MCGRKLKPTLARDFSVRSLPPPGSQLRGLADKLGVEIYDSRRAAAEAGFVLAPSGVRQAGWLL